MDDKENLEKSRKILQLVLPTVRGIEINYLIPLYGKNAETDLQIKADGKIHFGFYISYKPKLGGWRVLFEPEEIENGSYKVNFKQRIFSLCNDILKEFDVKLIDFSLGEKKDG